LDISKEELTEQTKQHINDVIKTSLNLSKIHMAKAIMHDNTKIDAKAMVVTDEFFEFIQKDFKTDWFEETHLIEPHHLATTDVNLLDIIEHLIDGACACYRRDKIENYRPARINQNVIKRAIRNTEEIILDLVKHLDNC